ncbi:MAG: hypothetical protein ABI597_13900 [Gammaproteobacteria bacterium]
MAKVTIDWKEMEDSLYKPLDYIFKTSHFRYVFLKKQLEKMYLTAEEHESAIKSLSDFLEY